GLNSPGFPHSFLDRVDQVLHAERFLQIERADLAEGGDSFFVGIVAGDDDNSIDEIGAVGGNPGMDLGSVDAAGCAHIRDDAEVLAFFQKAQSFGAGFDADDLVSATLERSGYRSEEHT